MSVTTTYACCIDGLFIYLPTLNFKEKKDTGVGVEWVVEMHVLLLIICEN